MVAGSLPYPKPCEIDKAEADRRKPFDSLKRKRRPMGGVQAFGVKAGIT
jgi:hypothetical protein